MELDQPTLILILEIVLSSGLIILAHALRKKFSLAVLYALIGCLLTISWWTAKITLSTQVAGSLVFLPSVFVTSILTAVFLAYAFDGPKPARILILVTLIINLVLPVFGYLFSHQISETYLSLQPRLAQTDYTSALISSFAYGLDFIAIGLLWEFRNKYLNKLPLFLVLFAFLSIVFCLDSLIFGLLHFNEIEQLIPRLADHWRVRVIAALGHSVLLLPYVYWQQNKYGLDEAQRPLLAVLNQEKLLEAELNQVKDEINKRQVLEESLKNREAMFRSLFEYSPSGILICNPAGTILEANPAALKILDRPLVDKPTFSVAQYLPDDIFTLIFKNKSISAVPDSVLAQINEKEFAITTLQLNPGKKQKRIVLLLQDLTEKNLLENELIHHDKLESLSLLAGGIAHDFNNLLTGILAGLSLARMQLSDAEPIESMQTLTGVEEQAELAADLTKQLLTFSKGGAPSFSSIDSAKFITETSKFAMRGSSASAQFNISPDVWNIRGDTGQLSQVINNLVINAIQAMPHGGRVTLNVHNHFLSQAHQILPVGRYVQIEIKDQGTGIPEEKLSKIFDPFFSTKKTGHGLGLASSFSIIKKHEGILEARNNADIGANFTMLLPASKEREQTIKRTVDMHHYNARVLLMDDQDTILKLMTRMLKQIGLEVSTAKNGEEAIIFYSQTLNTGRKFDLVIMDLTVPNGMGGRDCIKELYKLDPEVRAIVSSGYSDDEVMSEYQKFGFIDRLPKPYNISQVWGAIARALPEFAVPKNTGQ